MLQTSNGDPVDPREVAKALREAFARPLTEEDLFGLLQRALKDEERGLGFMNIRADDSALRGGRSVGTWPPP